MDTSEDIYDNLPPALNLSEEIEKLQHENNVQQGLIHSLESDIEKLCARITEMKKIQDNLTRNISELFKTAKAEIDRKDRMIADLRNQLEEANQRKHYRVPFKRERDNSPTLNQFTEDPGGKRRKHDESYMRDRYDESYMRDRYHENLKRSRSKSSDKYTWEKERDGDRANREKCFRSDKFKHDYEKRHFLNRGERIVERSYKINPATAKKEREVRETDKSERKEEGKSQPKNTENEANVETKTVDTVVRNTLPNKNIVKNIFNTQKTENETVKNKNPLAAEKSSVANKHLDNNGGNNTRPKIEEKNKEKQLTDKIVGNAKMKEVKIETKTNRTKIEEVTKKLFERLEEEIKQELTTCPVSVSLCNINDIPLATQSTNVISTTKETEIHKINDKEKGSQSIQQQNNENDPVKCDKGLDVSKNNNEAITKPVRKENKMTVTEKPDESNNSECSTKKVENDKFALEKNKEESEKIIAQKTDISNASELQTKVANSKKEEDHINNLPSKLNNKENKTVTSKKSELAEATENFKSVASNKSNHSVNRMSQKIDKKENKKSNTPKLIRTNTHGSTTKLVSQKKVDKKVNKKLDTPITDSHEPTAKLASQTESKKSDRPITDTHEPTAKLVSQKEVNKKENKKPDTPSDTHGLTTNLDSHKENKKLDTPSVTDTHESTAKPVSHKENKKLDTPSVTDTHEPTAKPVSYKENKKLDTPSVSDTHEPTAKLVSHKENKKSNTPTDTHGPTPILVSQTESKKSDTPITDTYEPTAKPVSQKEVNKKENKKPDTPSDSHGLTTKLVSQKEVDKKENKKLDIQKMIATNTHEPTTKLTSLKEIDKKEKKPDTQKTIASDTHKLSTKVVSKKENEESVKENPICEKENRKSVPRKIEKFPSELSKPNDKNKESVKEDTQKIHEKAAQKTEESQLKPVIPQKEKATEDGSCQPNEKEIEELIMIECEVKIHEFIEKEKDHSSILALDTYFDKSTLVQDNVTNKNDVPKENMKNESVRSISKPPDNTTAASKLEEVQENREKNMSNNKEKISVDHIKDNSNTTLAVDETSKIVSEDSGEQRNKNKKSEHKTNDSKAKKCKESTKKETKAKEKAVEATGGPREESDRVLRSATRRNSAREKLQKSSDELEDEQKSTHSTSPSEQAFACAKVELNGTPCVNLSHDGEIPVLHIEEISSSGFNNNIVKPLSVEVNELRDSIVFGLESNSSVVTSSPVCNRNIDKVREDLEMSSDNNQSSMNISKSDLSVSVSSINNSVEKVFNTSSARKRRRVILKMVD